MEQSEIGAHALTTSDGCNLRQSRCAHAVNLQRRESGLSVSMDADLRLLEVMKDCVRLRSCLKD